MDVFVEHMVKRRPTGKDIFLMSLYALLAVIVFVFGVFFTGPLLGPFSFVGAFIGVAALFGAYYLISNMNIEYEYIVTNGEIDVDKIMAKRRRKRLLTANARTFESEKIIRAGCTPPRVWMKALLTTPCLPMRSWEKPCSFSPRTTGCWTR